MKFKRSLRPACRSGAASASCCHTLLPGTRLLTRGLCANLPKRYIQFWFHGGWIVADFGIYCVISDLNDSCERALGAIL